MCVASVLTEGVLVFLKSGFNVRGVFYIKASGNVIVPSERKPC